jgi:hypothetical protein
MLSQEVGIVRHRLLAVIEHLDQEPAGGSGIDAVPGFLQELAIVPAQRLPAGGDEREIDFLAKVHITP